MSAKTIGISNTYLKNKNKKVSFNLIFRISIYLQLSGLCRGPATAGSRDSWKVGKALAMGDRRHHASEDSEALFRLLQAQMDFYIFLFGID